MILDEVSNQINELIVGQPANKKKFCEHIEKVIREAKKYRKYLQKQKQEAEKAGWTQCDESKDKDKSKWTWWTALWNDAICEGSCIYFADCTGVQFYIKGKPEPDPLGYLCSMVRGSVGQIYEGLELLDYQFILLAIIHDAQNLQAGRERIYFNKLEKRTLSDRLCQAVWHHLSEKLQQSPYEFKDVQNTIETALRAVKADLASTKKSQTSNGVKYWFKLVCEFIAGIGILLGILYTAIQIRESDTFKQFMVPHTQLQPTSDPNTLTDSNATKKPSKTPQDTSKTLPDLNLSPLESPNQ